MGFAPSQPVVHLELHTRDLAQARDFYSSLCGWSAERIHASAGSYLALELARGEIGGGDCGVRVGPCPLWLPYVEVPHIGAATERARELGATVLLEPREGPAGYRSVVAAPASGELAFWQPR